MAVVRARSSPPYGLFAAVTFAVLATAGAVVFYVMWSKANDDATASQTRLAELTSGNDQLKNANTKLGSDLSDARRALASAQADADANKAKLTSLKKLSDDAGARANAAEAAKLDQQKEFGDTIAKLLDAQAKLKSDIASANSDKSKAVADGQTALTDLGSSDEDKRRKLVLQLEDAQSTIAKLNTEIRELRARVIQEGRGTSDVTVGEPDGKIIRVNGATGEVYINLGKKDHLTAGLPFTAYDPRLGVRFGTDDQAAGNGSLEVIEVGEETSVCRITHTTTNRAIQAGDLISNIVYHNDRSRKYRFTVFGDFDLDGDGVATAAERDRLISLIRAWGGEVDDQVTSQTDYLILGAPPKAPLMDQSADAATAPADATAPAAVPGSVADVRATEQDRYKSLEVDAKRLAIPVLNQNRFLMMVGYYNTTVVRY